MGQIIIIRGLPGAGKSTRARALLAAAPEPDRCCWVEADHYFERDGAYVYNPGAVPAAHAACQAEALRAMRVGLDTVIVSNTFTRRWEWQPYADAAAAYGYTLTVDDLFDAGLSDVALAGRSVHGVPVAAVTRMRGRWQPS